MTDNEEHILKAHGIKPTANRILIVKALCAERYPRLWATWKDKSTPSTSQEFSAH